MAVAADFTGLVLSPLYLPPYSVRALSQSLKPIAAAGVLARDINGTLVNLSDMNFRKYESRVTCRDGQAMPFDGIYPGYQLTVDCVVELSYEDTTAATPSKTVVPGSSRSEDGLIFYRPRLIMQIVDWQNDFDEWDALIGWSLLLEEV